MALSAALLSARAPDARVPEPFAVPQAQVGRPPCFGLPRLPHRLADQLGLRDVRILRAGSKGFGSPDPAYEQELNPQVAGRQQRGPTFQELAASVRAGLSGTNIYLVGMMGSGKSTAGRMLADALRYAFFDSDTLVEQAAKKTVAEIFEEAGEEEFRELEKQVIQTLHGYKNCIVATGGGAVLKKLNWSYMQQGVVIWLNGPPSLLARRVVNDGVEARPLVGGGSTFEQTEGDGQYQKTVEKLEGILNERLPLYRNADIEVSLASTSDDDAGLMGAPVHEVVLRMLKKVDARIKEAAQMREDRKDFKIEENKSLTQRLIDLQKGEGTLGNGRDDTKEEK